MYSSSCIGQKYTELHKKTDLMTNSPQNITHPIYVYNDTDDIIGIGCASEQISRSNLYIPTEGDGQYNTQSVDKSVHTIFLYTIHKVLTRVYTPYFYTQYTKC